MIGGVRVWNGTVGYGTAWNNMEGSTRVRKFIYKSTVKNWISVRVWKGMKMFERLLRDLRRGIVPSFLCHSHSALCKFCPVALERTKR